MGTGYHSGFGNTAGADGGRPKLVPNSGKPKPVPNGDKPKPLPKKKVPIFDDKGHVTKDSIKARAEFFLGKSVARLEHELHKNGYETKRRPSIHSTSRAKIIMTLNGTKARNISQILVSPGSNRHGDVPYVKISTTDCGRIKIINAFPSEYKSDGREKAELIYRRIIK
jgi:hypothetical protein